MITLLAAVVAAGLLSGTLLGKLQNRRGAARARAKQSAGERVVPGDAGRDPRLRGLPCSLGDVVLLAHGDEAWLGGVLVLRERAAHADESGDVSRTTAALFIAPERGGDRAVYARAEPEASLDWMWPIAPDVIPVGTEPPSAVEHDGERFERARRLPLSVVPLGDGAPDVGESAIVAEYGGSAGGRLLVVVGARSTRVYRGRRLERGMYEVLPATTRLV